MTESEYKQQIERINQYNAAINKISIISEKKQLIIDDGLAFVCSENRWIYFDYLGEDFKQRLINNITSFFDLEIESIRKSMEDI